MISAKNYPSHILSSLTYELVNGQPILFQGHQAVVCGQKSLAALRTINPHKRHLLSELCFNLHSDFGQEYFILSNPRLRLQMDEYNCRAIDIALVKKTIRKAYGNEVIYHAPEYVFLIDTKASLIDLGHPFSYHHQKVNDLLSFGVQKVVWLFTEKQKLLVGSSSRRHWLLQDWDQPVWLEPGVRWDCPVYSKR